MKTYYEEWLNQQGAPIVRGFSLPSLNEVETGKWERHGVNGAIIKLDGAEDTNDASILEIPPGMSTIPEHHVYEEIIYVLEGRGACAVWQREDAKRSFEWHEGSLFAVPLNAWHRLYNGQGGKPCRLFVVSSAPLIINLYRNLEFVFQEDYAFTDRFDAREDYFSSIGEAKPDRVWETNFVEDVRTFPLEDYSIRGASGVNRRFHLADCTMGCHVSQFPVGTYKKGHRHGPGANVVVLNGQGYSLLWQKGREDQMVKVDWQAGSLLVPPNMWFHQHFNTGGEPAKYLAIRWGKSKHPFMRQWGTTNVDLKEGGDLIQYEDELPMIQELFAKELAKNGLTSRMPKK